MIRTVHLFPELEANLIDLLQSLSSDDWENQTVARLWKVRDVAAHLLDGNIRMLSFSRDGHSVPPDQLIQSYTDLVGYLNQLNADWVKAARRISPRLLTELLQTTGQEYCRHVATLDMNAPAPFSVAWAGEETSVNWFHIAREYTERWHHQQQIREATGIPGILNARLFFPCIETLMMGLPHRYRDIDATPGTTLEVTIRLNNGESLTRFLVKDPDRWKIMPNPNQAGSATLQIPADTAWKLFTKAITPDQARKTITITGDAELALTTLKLVAVMA